MAHGARRTEHCGAKNGCGSYYGRRLDAKADSKIQRRRTDKAVEREALLVNKRRAIRIDL